MLNMIQLLLLFVISAVSTTELAFHSPNFNTFSKNFLFGVATSAYQIEGAWNVSGKSESTWDRMIHTNPASIADFSTGDVACDAYNKLEEDVGLLKDLGVHFYRFSLSWPRILPSPLVNNVNKAGVAHYNRLINLLLKNNIQPVVTLFHWDLPQSLQDLGGFTSPLIIESFVNYARVAFENFGDRVKLWTTFNEPKIFCLYAYGDSLLAPAVNQAGIAEYICGHHLLLAHAKTYHLYDTVFRQKQSGRISINLDSPWCEPASSSKADKTASDRRLQFEMGWFGHPIFTAAGDYPKVMREEIDKRSKAEGFFHSRLPTFTKDEIELIRGTCDFFCLNHYTTFLTANQISEPIGRPSYFKDMNVNNTQDPSWAGSASSINKVVPWGLTKLLNWVKEEYGNPEILITENGFGDTGGVLDVERINFYKGYLGGILEAIRRHGVRVAGYTAWSFMDNFEWISGYTVKYGLYHVDFTNPKRPRTPKASAAYFKRVIRTRRP